MNEFFEDVRERKELIKGNRHKNHTTAGCKLPYEYLPKKEQINLNGEVSSVKLKKPMTWAEFKALIPSLQTEYLNYLIDHFRIGADRIGVDMFGLPKAYMSTYIRRKGLSGIKRSRKSSVAAIEGWRRWLAHANEPSSAPIQQVAEEPKPEPVEEPEIKPFRAHDYEDMLRECDLGRKDDGANKASELIKTVPYPTLQDMGINLEGTPVEIMTTMNNAIPALLDQNKTYRFSIKIDTFFLNHGDRAL